MYMSWRCACIVRVCNECKSLPFGIVSSGVKRGVAVVLSVVGSEEGSGSSSK